MHKAFPVKEKILLIEDNPDLIEIMRRYLTHRGYRVLHAQDGFEAIETAGSEIPDLVVMDVKLKDMDGVQIALELRKRAKTRHIPILAVTAKTFSDEACPMCLTIFSESRLTFTRLMLKFRNFSKNSVGNIPQISSLILWNFLA
ncbi:MAG TPA: response regulator [Candidatus Binatia bacterium]